MSKKLIKFTAITGGMTLLSRISGLVRDIAFANIMGSGLVADAFFVAFRVPNFFRRIFGEGALSQAFVPVFSEYKETATPEQIQAFLDHMTGKLFVILVLITVVGVLIAPGFVTVIAPGFLDNSQKFRLTVDALRICFPYLIFISLVAVSAGILNTCGKFAVPAATPVLLNLSLIGAAFWLVPVVDNAAIALSVGVVIAGLAQLLLQIPFLKKEGHLPKPRVRRADDGVKKVFRLMLPAIFGVSVAQINVLVNTLLASFLVTGSVSWLYYSDRVMEFPLGVFGIALATVILPSLSKLHARGDGKSFSELLDWALRWVFIIVLPAAIGLIMLADGLIATLFQYGATTPGDVRMMSNSLIGFALGLLGLVMVKILAPGFFARQNTRTPVKVGVIAMVVNMVVAIALFYPFKHVGLAIATSIAAWVNAGLLYKLLRADSIYVPQPGWLPLFLKVGTGSLIMAVVLYWCAGSIDLWINATVWERVSRLSLCVALGAVVYFAVLFAFGIRPKHLLLNKAELDL
jgi:putative peptidoglycan lipid II flippase